MTDQIKNNASRRDFIKKSALAGIGISTAMLSSSTEAQATEKKVETGVLNDSSKMLMSRFKLRYPIFQAAPGGEALAIAIADTGGMGAISLSWSSPEQAYEKVLRVKNGTQGNFYANYVLQLNTSSLDKALEAGCPAVQFSWGIPTPEMVKKIRAAGARLGIQVSSPQGTLMAMEQSPDFIICQGLEAGGHVQATSYLEDVLTQVLEAAGGVPVIVAGGISTGHDMRDALSKGAAGVVMGTRFVATKESDAHEHYKNRLVEAGEKSTVYTNCFSLHWNAMHRVLRNNTFNNWEAHGCPLEGSKPGENDVVVTHPIYGPINRYSYGSPFPGMEGDIDDMAMYAGEGVSNVKDLLSARELIERIWNEFENR
ncbi:MAG: nitronate monooxygenase [Bacteroidales bacterium]|nr:nitronate monooxygenase [Bacteroidales bacterium]